MGSSEILALALNWSNGDPELCAEMAVELDRLIESAYADGFKAALEARQPKKPEEPTP